MYCVWRIPAHLRCTQCSILFEVSPSVTRGSTGRFVLDGMVSLPWMRSWWATWLAVTRHGGFDEVESLYSLLIFFQAFRLL